MSGSTHRPRKRFGQHFLSCDQSLEAMVQAISPGLHSRLLEIGPGQGVLTQYLIDEVSDFAVIEIDKDLIAHLKKRFTDSSFVLHEGDVLDFDFSKVLRVSDPMCVVGNLPYNISTPLLFKLFEYASAISCCYFLLQKEVVDRLCAKPGSKRYGRLSVMAQYFCQADSLFDVPPSAFSPPPKVDSSFVRLVPHANLPATAIDKACFAEVVRTAFCYRRKMLKKIFQHKFTLEQWHAIGIDPTLRPEQVSVVDFVNISNYVSAGKA